MAKAPRPIRVEGAIAYIPLTRGHTAVIDAADVPRVSAWSWTAREKHRPDGSLKSVYVYRMVNVAGLKVNVMLHNVILPPAPITDHRNGNGLDCRRANLRAATHAENARNCAKPSHNTSGVKGVIWDKKDHRWVARIKLNGVRRDVGRAKCITAAAIAYAKASRQLHGDFGRLA